MTTVTLSNITNFNPGSESGKRANIVFGAYDESSLPRIRAQDLGLFNIHTLNITGKNEGNYTFAYQVSEDKSYAYIAIMDPRFSNSNATFTVVANATPVGNTVQMGVDYTGNYIMANNAVSGNDGNVFVTNSAGITDAIIVRNHNGSGNVLKVLNGDIVSDFSGMSIVNPPNDSIALFTAIHKWNFMIYNLVGGVDLYWNDTASQFEANIAEDTDIRLHNGMIPNDVIVGSGTDLILEVVGI